ncbi:MAG: hypothetical protein LJE66_11055, partial [Desulfobacterales bacterium]|nr:hypothetical protein [Desulfobacterales bacterium]
MKKELMNQISIDDHLGCLGNFNLQDPLCKKLCALNLRCAIESEKNTRIELLEDLISYNGML